MRNTWPNHAEPSFLCFFAYNACDQTQFFRSGPGDATEKPAHTQTLNGRVVQQCHFAAEALGVQFAFGYEWTNHTRDDSVCKNFRVHAFSQIRNKKLATMS